MLRRLFRHMHHNAVAWLALFVALGGTGAYAANTIGSADIIDGQVKSVDVGDAEIKSADVKDESLTTFDVSNFLGADVVDGTLTGSDVSDNSTLTGSDIAEGTLSFQNALQTGDIGTGAIRSDEIANTSIAGLDIINDTLTGVQINEASLNLPLSTVGFAGGGPVTLEGGLHKIAGKTLSQGVYAVVATVNTTVDPQGSTARSPRPAASSGTGTASSAEPPTAGSGRLRTRSPAP
jgi:hypothetical protein